MKTDTSAEIQAKYQEMLMALSPGERLAMACRMFDTARALVVAGLQTEENPEGHCLAARIFLRLYGSDFAPQERDRIVAVFNNR